MGGLVLASRLAQTLMLTFTRNLQFLNVVPAIDL